MVVRLEVELLLLVAVVAPVRLEVVVLVERPEVAVVVVVVPPRCGALVVVLGPVVRLEVVELLLVAVVAPVRDDVVCVDAEDVVVLVLPVRDAPSRLCISARSWPALRAEIVVPEAVATEATRCSNPSDGCSVA